MSEDRSNDSSTRFDEEVSRRKLLKILAASGTAVAASAVLPGKWMKPIVNMGILPAHAQQSGRFAINNLTGRRGSVIYDIVFTDPTGNVSLNNSYLAIWNKSPGCGPSLNYNSTIASWGGTIQWTSPTRGKIVNASSGWNCGPCDLEAQAEIRDNGRTTGKSSWVKIPNDPNDNCGQVSAAN